MSALTNVAKHINHIIYNINEKYVSTKSVISECGIQKRLESFQAKYTSRISDC